MFVKFHERLKDSEKGFTLIELLVVILIIAILAAIAIPVFLNQRKKGWRAQSQSALKDAAIAEETYATDNNGAYTTSLAELQSQGYNPTVNVAITFSATGGGAAGVGGFCLIATHALLPSSDTWKVASYDSQEGTPSDVDTC